MKTVFNVVKGEDNDGGELYTTAAKAAKALSEVAVVMSKGVTKNDGEREALGRLVKAGALERLADGDEYMWEDSRCNVHDPDPTHSYDDYWVRVVEREVL